MTSLTQYEFRNILIWKNTHRNFHCISDKTIQRTLYSAANIFTYNVHKTQKIYRGKFFFKITIFNETIFEKVTN